MSNTKKSPLAIRVGFGVVVSLVVVLWIIEKLTGWDFLREF